ncbi:hypothetical protein CANCADRAFT_63534 [Tortispora caseinolytica NRRL Y-17796]|uniref:MHD domain-containing protein n=1 Tax=Tortispora caseinolytica NRRL Y-17796 TaxID=767744 RepID=A0A1E4TK72_9ASCO|nr:hypothetical protein CANCADRAFT_63534 [Tortispora caseinolytica NRRL Y-17796]
MIAALFFYNKKGELVLARTYRDGLRRSIAEVFRIRVISNPSAVPSPVLTIGSTSYYHITHEDLYVVAVGRTNAAAATIFEFLYCLVSQISTLLGSFNSASVKDNVPVLYEFLEEVADFGYPQITEFAALSDHVVLDFVSAGPDSYQSQSSTKSEPVKPTAASVSWRTPGLKYKRNEVFVDVIEELNCIFNAYGDILSASVAGKIIMKSSLSGTPECKFGLNDASLEPSPSPKSTSFFLEANTPTKDIIGEDGVTFQNCQFHQCVRLGRFDSDRTISFIPPDGEFELMTYRAIDNIRIPFKVFPSLNFVGTHKIDYNVSLKSYHSSLTPGSSAAPISKLHVQDVVITIPTPSNVSSVQGISTTGGKAKYDPSRNAIIWKFSRLNSTSDYSLTASAELISMVNRKPWAKPPIQADFTISMFASSGLAVKYLKIFEPSNYSTVKWVKYVTKAGSYEIRI